MSYQVSLHLYDLSNGMARTMSRNFLGKQIDGIWHTGIIAYGKEFYYGGGICQDPPGKTPYGNPMKTIPIGSTEIPEDIFLDFLKEINYKFTADKYDLFENNCNNFSDACSEFLTGSKIPSYITGLPKEVLATPMGQMIKPMITQMQQNMQQNSHPMFSSPNQGGMGGGFGAPNNFGGMNPTSYNNVPQYAQPQQGGAVLNITSPDEFTRVIKNSPAVIVDFFSYTCPPCMKIKPIFESLAKTFQTRCPGLKFVSVNTQEARMISTQHQITSIPTFVAFLGGSQFQRFSGADAKRVEGLAYTLESKINSKDGKGITANGTSPSAPSFHLFNPNKKDFFIFSGVNYPPSIKNITEKLAGYPALNENEAKEIFTKFSDNPQDKVKSFSQEEKTYLVNWIFETMFYIEISDKTLGFLDLLRMLSLDESFLEIIFKSEDKLYQIIRFFEKPEQTLKELPKGLKLVLLRLMTNLTATDKCRSFFQNNLSTFIELMIRAGNLYRDDKSSLYPILMTIWNLVQHLYNTKEFATSAGSIVHFTRLIFNESTDNELLLGCALIMTWLSFYSIEVRKAANQQVDKAKLAKLEFSEDQNLGKMTRDLSDILKGVDN